jgi:hypothetical protein
VTSVVLPPSRDAACAAITGALGGVWRVDSDSQRAENSKPPYTCSAAAAAGQQVNIQVRSPRCRKEQSEPMASASGEVHRKPLEIGERAVVEGAFVRSPQNTRGAWPASSASCQRGAHTHQRSPGLRPGKPNCGIGVERSLPQDLENSRNSAVMTAQTVWLPTSSRLVLQQPSRKNPVMGFTEQSSSRSPRTFLGACGRPPPFPVSSLSTADPWIAAAFPYARNRRPPSACACPRS